MLLDIQCLRLKREVGSPEQNIFGTRIFVFALRYDTENELVVCCFSYLFFVFFFFLSDGIFQISVTNRSSNFKPLWLFYLS